MDKPKRFSVIYDILLILVLVGLYILLNQFLDDQYIMLIIGTIYLSIGLKLYFKYGTYIDAYYVFSGLIFIALFIMNI